MLLMIQGHTIYAIADPSTYDITQFPWNLWQFIRGLTAPVFLFVSGAVHVFANKREPDGTISKERTKRRINIALILIFIGYILVFPAERIYDLPFIEYKYWAKFFQVNILQLFGVSLLLLLAVFKLTKNDKSLSISTFVIAMFITFFTPIANLIDWTSFLPNVIAYYFTSDGGSIFTIFPFTSYLFFGVSLGVFLKGRSYDVRINFLRFKLPFIAFGVVVLGYVTGEIFADVNHDFLQYSSTNPGLTFIRLGFSLVILVITAFIFSITKQLTYYYNLFGKRALFIYVIHLFIIYGTTFAPGLVHLSNKSLPIGLSVLLAVLVQITSLIIIYLIHLSLSKFRNSSTFYKYAITAYLIFILFF